MLRSSIPHIVGRARRPLKTTVFGATVRRIAATTPTLQQRQSFASVVPPRAQDPTKLDEITTLPNGIRVASEALPDAFSGVGVYIDAGSRYENEYLRGASHIMDRLAFKSTNKRSADDMLEAVESLGGNIQCASSRESMMYQAATFNSAIPTATELLAETIRNPLMTNDEVAQQLETAAYEVKEIWAKPELILPELVHMAAFKDNTLGNPLLCPEERLGAIDGNVIRAYREAFYQPERMVVAFAGISHEESVRLAVQHFGDMKPTEPISTEVDATASVDESDRASIISSSSSSSTSTSASTATSSVSSAAISQPSKLLSKIPFFKNISTSAPQNASVLSSVPSTTSLNVSAAHYTGGFLSLPPQPPPLNPNLPTFTHIQLAFEGLPISSDDIYALATLQTLLGGGGSFSAGGPGKGMYSRLYTNVLNQYGWVESCIAFNHSYADSGLFGIAASCYPGRTAQMLEVMCRELRSLSLDNGFSALGQAEVNRAKNQLRSSLLMNLESRMVELEDLGRQVQIHGHKIPVHEMVRRINSLTVADLRRVARIVVQGMVENPGRGSGAPTVVLQEAEVAGTGAKQMQWEEIQDIIYRWQLGKR
ncbi:mitochondrial processing peptidase [Sporothrix brasiliensis 5110]|uniref:Mitochondrial-processing peptidase subunit alpha n=1 Tax=Sporothrix brasiliensis 5110 TaxID=1398154 RepID=A0A0C2J121_9PEZI|nr:mitochondrial processing peptidase [Sporothrix brasiliensis 5110]KIH92690.1 mitochondrial processing peptidase [Sporothrix brasiliensis 5110]